MTAVTRQPTFVDTVASEAIKLATLRAARRNAVLAVALGVGLSALLALLVGATYDEWTEADQAGFDPILFSVSGGLFAVIFLTALGVNSVAPEYSSRMMPLTLTATPKRARIVLAKALVVSVAVAVLSLVSSVGMFLAGQAVFAATDLEQASLVEGDALLMLVMLTVTSPVFPVLGMSLAVVTRSTAAALSATLAVIFTPAIFGELLPEWSQRNVLGLLPGSAADSLSIGHLTDSAMYREPWLAAVLVVVWLVALLALAVVVLQRRDA